MKNSNTNNPLNKKSTKIDSKKKNMTSSQRFQYYCGDKTFIKTFFKLFLPSAAQNFLIILIMFLNNLYLAIFCGPEVKTSVALSDSINSFVILVLIAWSGGVAVMMSQYYGSKDYQKTQQVLVYSFASSVTLMLPFMILLAAIPQQLMDLSSNMDQTTSGAVESTNLEYGRIYLQQMSWAFVPLIFNELMSTGLQSTEKAGVSLIGATVSTVISAIFDPIAIYFTKDNPALSVLLVVVIDGIGRFCQMAFLFIYVYVKKYQPLYFFKKIKVTKEVWTKTFKYGLPSFLNDFFFAILWTIQTLCIFNYSADVTHYNDILGQKEFGNIQNAATNVTLLIQFANVIWPGIAAAIAIQVGSYLGEGRIEEAKLNARRSWFWSFVISMTIVLLMFGASWGINDVLNLGGEAWINKLSMYMEWAILPSILSQGIFSINYYSVKSGGNKYIAVFDSGIMLIWTAIMAGLTFSGSLQSIHPALYMFMIQIDQIIRMIVSSIVFKYANWARNLTIEQEEKSLKDTFKEFKNKISKPIKNE